MTEQRRLIPVAKWADYHTYPTVSGMRYLVFHEATNGLSKAIRRLGKRVLIDEQAFFEWVDETGKDRPPQKVTGGKRGRKKLAK